MEAQIIETTSDPKCELEGAEGSQNIIIFSGKRGTHMPGLEIQTSTNNWAYLNLKFELLVRPLFNIFFKISLRDEIGTLLFEAQTIEPTLNLKFELGGAEGPKQGKGAKMSKNEAQTIKLI